MISVISGFIDLAVESGLLLHFGMLFDYLRTSPKTPTGCQKRLLFDLPEISLVIGKINVSVRSGEKLHRVGCIKFRGKLVKNSNQ